MSASVDPIEAVGAAIVSVPLPQPIRFGSWSITHREYCLASVRSRAGLVGRAFTLTRDGPVAAVIGRSLRGPYVGGDPADAPGLYDAALATNRPTLSAGVGLRAHSLVDLATWDLAARQEGKSIEQTLGGESARLPVRAVVGYPGTGDGDEVADEIRRLMAIGWRHFKLPISGDVELTVRRVRAAVDVAGEGQVSLDAAWLFRDGASIRAFTDKLGVTLEWLEDVTPPGDVQPLLDMRDSGVRIAIGDEQGGPYFPDGLLSPRCVDVIRLDATTMGGLTPFPVLAKRIAQAGAALSTHMAGHVHARILGGLGMTDVAVEWGPGPWVDPYEASIGMPDVVDGFMVPLEPALGFGRLVADDWIREQIVDDPDSTLNWS